MTMDKILFEGLTYDDVLLIPEYSEVLPREVNIGSFFSKNISLNAPIVSAAMDTVTESELAIAIARQGGIGVLHKNMSIQAQASEVRKVKRSQSGMIQDPITLKKSATVKKALQMMKEHSIGGIPVVDKDNTLIGIVTNRDLRFEKEFSKKIAKVMTHTHIITAKEGTNLEKAEQILQKHKIEKLPVINSQGKLTGLITYKDILKVKIAPNACVDKHGRLRVAAAIGITPDIMLRAKQLVDAGVDALVIDTAHGHSKGVIEALKQIKKQFKKTDIVVGNIATEKAAKALIKAGADGVKVGIGPGSICTTRIIAGVGVPQLSAILHINAVCQKHGVPLIADGGIKYTGDVVKALAAGASCVMMGSMFAGVEESPGETILFEARKFKSYRGMGSIEAMQEGSKDRYFQDMEDDIKKLVPEGISGRVPYKGFLSEIMFQLLGGLRAGMGYCGASNIEMLQSQAKFVKISAASMRESHPHGVAITREAPNYSYK